MTGQDWLKLIRENKESILDQIRPHWRDALDNFMAGVEVLLYLQSDGTITTHTRALGASEWRQSPDLLPLGDSYSLRPGESWTESDFIRHVIDGNALHDW